MIVGGFITFGLSMMSEDVGAILGGGLMIIVYLGMLGSMLPLLALNVRRLHDQGKEWTYILMGLIPFAGGIISLIHMVTEGTRGPNQYGPDPKNPVSLDEHEFGSQDIISNR